MVLNLLLFIKTGQRLWERGVGRLEGGGLVCVGFELFFSFFFVVVVVVDFSCYGGGVLCRVCEIHSME